MKARDYHLVAEDGVATASQLQQMIDRWARERHLKHGPAASTVDAFKLVVRSGDFDKLTKWLLNHSDDAPALLEMLEAPRAVA